MLVRRASERERGRGEKQGDETQISQSFIQQASSQVKVRENKKEETLLMHQVVNIDL